jgi:hypothetical protein
MRPPTKDRKLDPLPLLVLRLLARLPELENIALPQLAQ